MKLTFAIFGGICFAAMAALVITVEFGGMNLVCQLQEKEVEQHTTTN